MAMGKIERICSIMIMLGAEEVEFKTKVNDKLEKQQIISFSSKAWLQNGMSEKFNLLTPFLSKKNLTDRSLHAQMYLYSKNFEAKTAYEKETVKAVKKYLSEATIDKFESAKLYDELSKVQANFASKKELDRQEAVAENVYELLPKRSARRNLNAKSTPKSLATFVCQVRDVKTAKENVNI